MIQEFLVRRGMSPQQVDLAATCRRFLDDMTSGLAGEPASMLMLPTYLTHEGELPRNLPVAVSSRVSADSWTFWRAPTAPRAARGSSV